MAVVRSSRLRCGCWKMRSRSPSRSAPLGSDADEELFRRLLRKQGHAANEMGATQTRRNAIAIR